MDENPYRAPQAAGTVTWGETVLSWASVVCLGALVYALGLAAAYLVVYLRLDGSPRWLESSANVLFAVFFGAMYKACRSRRPGVWIACALAALVIGASINELLINQ